MCGVEISLPKQPTSEYPASSHIISTMEGRPLLILNCSDSSLRITIVANGSTRYYAGYDRRDAPRAADGGNVNGAVVVVRISPINRAQSARPLMAMSSHLAQPACLLLAALGRSRRALWLLAGMVSHR